MKKSCDKNKLLNVMSLSNEEKSDEGEKDEKSSGLPRYRCSAPHNLHHSAPRTSLINSYDDTRPHTMIPSLNKHPFLITSHSIRTYERMCLLAIHPKLTLALHAGRAFPAIPPTYRGRAQPNFLWVFLPLYARAIGTKLGYGRVPSTA
jgi:hypothetical protein